MSLTPIVHTARSFFAYFGRAVATSSRCRSPALPQDDVRALRVDGRIEYLAEPLYHGDPVRPGQGVLVWRIFGTEMFTRLQTMGFTTMTMRLREPRHGIIGDALVFVARKP